MTRLFSRRLTQLAAGAALAISAAGAAQAAYVVNTAGIDGSVGGLAGTISYAPTGLQENAEIGRLTLSGTNSDSGAAFNWASYCVDIFDTLKSGTFTASSADTLNLSAGKLSQLNALVSNVGAYVTNATTSAAAQLAVWEIVNETSSSYDLASGAFSVSNINGDATTDANRMLQAVTTGYWKATDTYGMTVLVSNGNQSQLVYGRNAPSVPTAAAPEPATWGTMVVGFGAIGLATRRRRKAAVASA